MAEYRDPTHLTEAERKNINLLATAIRQKMYGIDVREAIALAIELTFDTLAKENNDAYGEVIQARGVWETLEQRLDNLSVEDINKNLGKIDQTYLTDELIAQIAGTAAINAVPADNSLTTAKYVDNSITSSKIANGEVIPKKTNFFKPEKEEVKVEGLLIDKEFYYENVGGYNTYNKIVQSSGGRILVLPVSPNEILTLNRGTTSFTTRVAFTSTYPTTFPHYFTDVQIPASYPTEIKVPANANYLLWHLSNNSTIPTYSVFRDKLSRSTENEEPIYEWSENLFKDQVFLGQMLTNNGRIAASANYVTVAFPVKSGEVYNINKNSGTYNLLGFLSGHYGIDAITISTPIEPKLPAEIKVPNGATYMVWTVRTDNFVPAITIQKKVFKRALERDKQFPSNSSSNISYGSIIEHEWRSTKNHVYVSPKVFVVDGFNTIYSTTDYGQTYREETTLDFKPFHQYSNIGHRMLFKQANNGVRDGFVRIYTDDYKLISEYQGIWPGYNENGADGQPGVDGTWIFGEYISTPAGGNLGLGMRVMQTKDNGKTWNVVLTIPDVQHIHSCRYDPYNRNHIYVNTGDATDNMNNRWYVSKDNGSTWTQISGGKINEGKTPLIDGTFAHDKYMRTTALVMGVDSGPKGRNSIFYLHDNIPTSLVRFDKTTQKFQVITGDLGGVAYCTTLTDDGLYTIVETATDYDLLHYVLFPNKDDDIDKPDAYQVFTVKLPHKGYRAMQKASRQIDLAGNSILARNQNSYNNVGKNLTNNATAKQLGLKVNFGWSNDENGELKLTVMTRPIMPIY